MKRCFGSHTEANGLNRSLRREYCSRRSCAQDTIEINNVIFFSYFSSSFVFASARFNIINCTVFHLHILLDLQNASRENMVAAWAYAYSFQTILTYWQRQTNWMPVGQCAYATATRIGSRFKFAFCYTYDPDVCTMSWAWARIYMLLRSPHINIAPLPTFGFPYD